MKSFEKSESEIWGETETDNTGRVEISAPRSPTISSRSGEIAPRSLTFKMSLHA